MLEISFEEEGYVAEKISIKSYHERPEISKSDLDLLAKSPLHYKMKNELKKPPSEALILGSCVHKLVLEREDFSKEFCLEPKVDKRTKEGKATYKNFLEKLGDRMPISWDSAKTAIKMAAKVVSKKATTELLKDGLAEQSYFSQIEGVAVKCRPDFYNENLNTIIDLKTTSDASPTGFAKTIGSLNYHVQAAFYSDILRSLGKKVDNFVFIAVETEYPYFMGFYDLDYIAMEKGREVYLKLLDLYKFCSERDEWPEYVNRKGDKIEVVQTLSLPTWKFYENIA